MLLYKFEPSIRMSHRNSYSNAQCWKEANRPVAWKQGWTDLSLVGWIGIISDIMGSSALFQAPVEDNSWKHIHFVVKFSQVEYTFKPGRIRVLGEFQSSKVLSKSRRSSTHDWYNLLNFHHFVTYTLRLRSPEYGNTRSKSKMKLFNILHYRHALVPHRVNCIPDSTIMQ